MPAIAAIATSSILSTVARTTSTSVSTNETYSPEGFANQGVARWVDRSDGIAVGYPNMTISIRPPTKASRVYKVTLKYVLPTLEQTSASTATGIQPAPTKAYECMGITEFYLPERSTRAERVIFLSLFRSFFVDTIACSDGTGTASTASPLPAAVLDFDPAY